MEVGYGSQWGKGHWDLRKTFIIFYVLICFAVDSVFFFFPILIFFVVVVALYIIISRLLGIIFNHTFCFFYILLLLVWLSVVLFLLFVFLFIVFIYFLLSVFPFIMYKSFYTCILNSHLSHFISVIKIEYFQVWLYRLKIGRLAQVSK